MRGLAQLLLGTHQQPEPQKKKRGRKLFLLPLKPMLITVTVVMVLLVLIVAAIGVTGEDATPRGGGSSLAGSGGSATVSGIPYADIFNQTAALGIDPRLVAAVAWHESMHFNEDVIACRHDSPAGARGIMQFMPDTARGMVPAVDPCDPASAIPGGARYLLAQYQKFGTWELALAAYNAGPGAVSGCRCVPVNGETDRYVPIVMAKWEEYKTQFPGGGVAPQGGGPFGPEIDAYATYDGQDTCDSTPKPGVVAVLALLDQTYGHHASNIPRGCGQGGTSEHKEGRAVDYMLNVNNPDERAIADRITSWLLATDEHGNEHAVARRLGVMYVIWNHQVWEAYRPDAGWQPYTGDNPHTDHIHISFSWAGANQQTSWWTGRPAPR